MDGEAVLSAADRALVEVACQSPIVHCTLVRDVPDADVLDVRARLTGGATCMVRVGHWERVYETWRGDRMLREVVDAEHLPPWRGYAEQHGRAALAYGFVPGAVLHEYAAAQTDGGEAIALRTLGALARAYGGRTEPRRLECWGRPRPAHHGPQWAEIVDLIRRADVEAPAPVGICHGDLRTGNVLVRPDGMPVFLDPGNARQDACVLRDYAVLEATLSWHGLERAAAAVRAAVADRWPEASYGPWIAWAEALNWSHQRATAGQREHALRRIREATIQEAAA